MGVNNEKTAPIEAVSDARYKNENEPVSLHGFNDDPLSKILKARYVSLCSQTLDRDSKTELPHLSLSKKERAALLSVSPQQLDELDAVVHRYCDSWI